MLHKTKLIFVCIGLIVIAIIAGEMLYIDTNSYVKYITEFHAVNSRDTHLINFKILSDIRKKRELNITGSYMTSSSVRVMSGKNVNIWSVYTDLSYADVYGLNFIHGSFSFGEEHSAVIGEELAYKLFMSKDVVGFPIYIDDKEYIVSGVYSEDAGFIAKISKSLDMVYFRFDDINTSITKVAIKGGRDPAYYLSILDNAARYRLSGYFGVSLKDELQLTTIPRILVIMLLMLVAIFFLVKAIITEALKIASKIKEELNGRYFWETIKFKRLHIIFRLCIIIILTFGIAAAIWVMIRFKVPSFLIPYENIFNFSFYKSVVLQRFNEQNMIIYPTYHLGYIHIRGILISALYMSIIPILLVLLLVKPDRRHEERINDC